MKQFRLHLLAAAALTVLAALVAAAPPNAAAAPQPAFAGQDESAAAVPLQRVFLPLVVGPPAQPAELYHYVPGSATCLPNAGVSYYSGEVRDREGRLQNGVCVHVAFYGPRNTKCSGCDGVGDGQWGFAPYGGSPAPAGIPVEIFVVPCPAYLPPGGQSSGWGDLTPLSDKWLYTTTSTSMQCTGITFKQN